MTKPFPNQTISTIHYTNPLAINHVSNHIITCLPKTAKQIIVLCIGTDRSTGDSLGPLTGTLLSQKKLKYLNVFGTLVDPVHALNLEHTIKEIYQIYENPFIIAIDASLGRAKSVGKLHSGLGSITPGAAFNKGLPDIGDAFITGIVNISGLMEYSVLQSTRLSLVYEMATKLTTILYHVDRSMNQFSFQKETQLTPNIKINRRYTL